MLDERTSSLLDRSSRSEFSGSVVTEDGISLHVRRWPADSNRRSRVLIVHGHSEHSGRYQHVARRLAESGHEVWAFDLRGHGRSDGRRAYVGRFVRYVADLGAVINHVQSTGPSGPFFLLGHSMGGLIVLTYALTAPISLTGVIASSPFLISAVPVSRPLLRFANLLSAVLPALPTLDISGRRLTHDEAMSRDREADGLIYRGRVRARTGNEMRHAGMALLETAHQLSCPLYVFHGTGDELAEWTASLVLFGRTGSDDKTVTLYRDLFHETLNEVQRERIIASVVEWMDDQLVRAANPPIR